MIMSAQALKKSQLMSGQFLSEGPKFTISDFSEK